MQRKTIDQVEFDDLHAAMTDMRVDTGEVITTAIGTHPLYGGLILIAASGEYTVLGNDVHLIVGENETLEDDVAGSDAAIVAEFQPEPASSDPIAPTYFGCTVSATKTVGGRLILRNFSVGLPESRAALEAVLVACPDLSVEGFDVEAESLTITYESALRMGLAEGEVREHTIEALAA